MERQPHILKKRLLRKVERDAETGCWLFTGYVSGFGYGQMWDGEKLRPAHRLSFELFKGKLKKGFETDHLCRNRRCVNPEHLEAVTRRENLLRGNTITARNKAKTHCIRGHPLSDANLYVAKNGTRQCRICKKANYTSWVAQNRERRRELDRRHYSRHRIKE